VPSLSASTVHSERVKTNSGQRTFLTSSLRTVTLLIKVGDVEILVHESLSRCLIVLIFHLLYAGSWGYNRMAGYDEYETTVDLIHQLIETVALNGNLLLNVGPAPDGTMPAIFVDRLVGIGDWLKVNGEAIFKSRPWTVCQNETATNVYYTTREDNTTNGKTLYALIREWPVDNKLRLVCPEATNHTHARMLGLTKDLKWSKAVDMMMADSEDATRGTKKSRRLQATKIKQGLELDLPALNPSTIPCQHAWVVALTGIGNL
jgi:alpha-L-fucosidase